MCLPEAACYIRCFQSCRLLHQDYPEQYLRDRLKSLVSLGALRCSSAAVYSGTSITADCSRLARSSRPRFHSHGFTPAIHTQLLAGVAFLGKGQLHHDIVRSTIPASTVTMKTSGLPSYTAATTKLDPWGIVAPYVPASSYTTLCLTSRTLHAHCAPRLWNDPLRMVQLLRLDRNEGEGFLIVDFYLLFTHNDICPHENLAWA